MVALIASLAAWACPEPGPPEASFVPLPKTPGVQVIVEVWPAGAPTAWADAVLDTLDARSVAALVVLPAGLAPGEVADLLPRLGDSRHALGISLPAAMVPTALGEVKTLRAAVSPLEKAAGERARVVVAPAGSQAVEGSLAKAGFRIILDARGSTAGTPRPAAHFDGQLALGVVLPPGPWDAPTGPPFCTPLSPASLDGLARTLERAAGSGSIVRWPIVGRGGALADAAVLGRWFDEVGGPSGAVFGAGAEAVSAFEGRGVTAPVSGTGVPEATLREAAELLATGEVLPRALPGDLSLTQVFLGLAMHAAGRGAATVVVPSSTGPSTAAGSTTTGPEGVDRAALELWARDLTGAVPVALPAAARLGSRVYPAREILLALASRFLGDDPPTTRPVADPDPHAPHLGWD